MTDTLATLPVDAVCRWMAGLFLAPLDREALAAYRGAEGHAMLVSLEVEPSLAKPVRDMRVMTAPGANLGAEADRMASAHSGLFVVAGSRAAPPYASVWLSERGLLYQEPARAMNRLLGELDIALRDEIREPPDHLSFQLNLLAELEVRKRAGASVPVAPGAFIRDHLMTWVPAFVRACARARTPFFYPGLATAMQAYLIEKYQ